jgi:SAM-dependent methyltransferase
MSRLAEFRQRNQSYWDDAAPGWVAHADQQDLMGKPLGLCALERLAVRTGERVVDVGCGCGGTTAELATAAGPSGAAVGVDLADAMVAAAQHRFPALDFHVVDVETATELPGGPYDAAFSRMVLMLLADPVAGCGTIRRSLRPGGRLAATTFRDIGSSPWLPAVMLGAAPYVGALPPMPIGDEPGPFAFADSERPRTVLTEAGFVDVAVEAVDVALEPAGEPDAVVEALIEVGPAGVPYRAADVDARAAARAGARRLLDPFSGPSGGFRLPTGLWLLTAGVPA